MAVPKKWWGLGLSASLLAAILSGCSSGSNNGNNGDAQATASASSTESASPSASGAAATASPASALDTSKKVELQFYMVGDAPADLKEIESKINEMALQDLNATVKFNFTTWSDWSQKYKLLLASGQPIDLIFTADWTQYQTYANKGAFLPLDDLLPKSAPELHGFVPKEMWDAVKVGGKIYTVPSTYEEYVTDGIVYREDLRKKYNLPVPDSLEHLENYLDGIKKNEPGMTPIADKGNLHVEAYQLHPDLKNMAYKVGSTPYGLNIPYDDPHNVTSYWGSQAHLDMLKIFKGWTDKGYLPRNQLNDATRGPDLFASGKAAVVLSAQNPTAYGQLLSKMAGTGMEIAYFPYPMYKGYSTPVHPIHNGFAIPTSSANPERALAFYEKLVLDKRYNLLTEYGVEGKHYEVSADGHYQAVGDAGASGFPREGMNGWAWRNPEYMLFDTSYDVVGGIFKQLETISKPDFLTGLAEDYTPYQAERAALEQVQQEYLAPLEAGVVKDVEAGLKTFMEKAKAAGLDKVQDGYKQQLDSYLTEIGR
ncbi:extracellular solute-binding protein [Cohnella hashimotonis]|uniref:Extracellular solute-binding protein n=1 Tax=Cohnella hashimotonis TaxID=2826895 RepID=A0ABT6TEB3_9BACL|nr:extracellular solute-binding protein [Cohnella hashimotonis]MDI4645157.1 extracellular solute-binding protein [Cohnella hashimotonis]